MEGKPVGLVYIGVIIKDTVFTFEYMFEGDRNQIREACVKQGIKKILELI
jgi:nicotinamide mononucleotide (NMN) deamidase PncC